MLTPAHLRRVFGAFATGVTVVTSAHQGTVHGMTVNSFSSVSLDPPLVLYCSTSGTTLDLVRGSGYFAINVLTSGQLEIARRFAGLTPQSTGDRFAGLEHSLGAGGCPLLQGCLAHIECQVLQFVPAGDHEVVIGRVLALQDGEGDPLLFHRGKFASLGS